MNSARVESSVLAPEAGPAEPGSYRFIDDPPWAPIENSAKANRQDRSCGQGTPKPAATFHRPKDVRGSGDGKTRHVPMSFLRARQLGPASRRLWRERQAPALEILHFRPRIPAVIIASGGQRLCRLVVRKGFAFPWRASDLVLRLRLRLSRRGAASPKSEQLNSENPERRSLSARQGGTAARDNQTDRRNSRAGPSCSRGQYPLPTAGETRALQCCDACPRRCGPDARATPRLSPKAAGRLVGRDQKIRIPIRRGYCALSNSQPKPDSGVRERSF